MHDQRDLLISCLVTLSSESFQVRVIKFPFRLKVSVRRIRPSMRRLKGTLKLHAIVPCRLLADADEEWGMRNGRKEAESTRTCVLKRDSAPPPPAPRSTRCQRVSPWARQMNCYYYYSSSPRARGVTFLTSCRVVLQMPLRWGDRWPPSVWNRERERERMRG